MLTVDLVRTLNELLDVKKFKDYAPNGLQVQGREQTNRIICGVSASEELIDLAIERGADTIIVHHGYFWKGEDPRIIGVKQKRLTKLLTHQINLIAYHLPLDAHPQLGNNAILGQRMGVIDSRPLEDENLVTIGRLSEPQPVEIFGKNLGAILNRPPMVVSINSAKMIETVAWCTGSAQDFLELASRNGADAYVSGEISERTVLESRELDTPYFSVGHHASEVFGISALADWLRDQFPELDVTFVNIDNPV